MQAFKESVAALGKGDRFLWRAKTDEAALQGHTLAVLNLGRASWVGDMGMSVDKGASKRYMLRVLELPDMLTGHPDDGSAHGDAHQYLAAVAFAEARFFDAKDHYEKGIKCGNVDCSRRHRLLCARLFGGDLSWVMGNK